MRGEHRRQETMVSYVATEARVPERHPLRAIWALVDQALTALDAEFEAVYSHTGCPSIPPEYLLRATQLQILYSVRSERLLVQRIDYNLLYRWFTAVRISGLARDYLQRVLSIFPLGASHGIGRAGDCYVKKGGIL